MKHSLLVSLALAVIVSMNAHASDWVVVNEFAGSKTYVDRASITQEASFVQAAVKYVLSPPGTDRRNGKAVTEMLILEEYDIDSSRFRVHQIVFTYEGGAKSEPLAGEPTWRPATAGNAKTMEYLRRERSLK